MTLCLIAGGFWTSWCPFALPQGWPFSWWLVVIDCYSRKLICVQLFPSQPTAAQHCDTLDLAVAVDGSPPKYAVTDKGLILTPKAEGLRRPLMPLDYVAVRDAVAAIALWYDHHPSHQALRGATPEEVWRVAAPARDGPRFEPRSRYPATGKLGARVPAAIRAERGVRLELVLHHVEGRQHLPTYSLWAA